MEEDTPQDTPPDAQPNTEQELPLESKRRLPWVRILRTFALVCVCILGLLTFSAYTYMKNLGVFSLDMHQLEHVANFKFKDNSKVFDRNGNLIAELYDSYQIYTPINKIPKQVIDTVIAIEDRRFYEHHGVDIKGVLRAVTHRIMGRKTLQGGSTITQQVVRNLLLSPEKTMERKIIEIAWSWELEKRLSKEKILEIYLNALFLGNGSYGVTAAAHRYFSKNLDELTPEQVALIAGLFQSPSRFNPLKNPKLARARQKQVLTAMMDAKMLTPQKRDELAKKKLHYAPSIPTQYLSAPYFVDYIREQSKEILKRRRVDGQGLRIYTTLDPKVQSQAEVAVANSKESLDATEKHSAGTSGTGHLESAMLVTNPSTGEILGMVGGRDYKQSQFNRAASSRRSPGSAFKPIVYATALQSGMKWNDVLYVSPVNVENYKPKNYGGEYLTESTLFRAFYRSLNSPTVDVANQIGIKRIIEKARDFGFESPLKDEMGTALGSSDATLLDMARVYGVFANSGNRVELNAITKIEDNNGGKIYQAPTVESRTKHVLSQPVSYMLVSGMKAVLKHGTGYSSHDLAAIAAGKTGTSNLSTDNWFCGFTPELVSIVWVGTDDHTPMYGNQTGGTLALPIWDHFIRSTYATRKPKDFIVPAELVMRRVDPVHGQLSNSGVEMPFLTSQQPEETRDWQKITTSTESGGYRNVFAK